MSEEKKAPEAKAEKKAAAPEIKPDLERVEPEIVKKGKAAKGEGEGKIPKEKKQKGEKGAQAKAEPVEDKVYKRDKPPRLRAHYEKDVVPLLMKEFGYTNKMEVPRLTKITLNMGLGEAIINNKIMDSAVAELTAIAGQRPVVTKAKKSIATYKLRQGQKIGAMVTLRRERMWEFFDRFVNLALPRVRDFKGISPKSFDGRGNFSAGIKEQIIFPEVDYDKIDKIKGLNVTIGTTARTDNEGRALLKHLGMPFRTLAGPGAER
jgi:large subunit ribosomal protein L5